jgi:hypothetical protein
MKFVGERRALAAVIFGFYFLGYLGQALDMDGDPMGRPFFALAGVYGLAFFSLVAGYFWARWYAVGVSLFGVIVAAIGLWKLGGIPALRPMLFFVGGTHLGATLMLWGSTMSVAYDGQTAWRERFHMDDSAVQRLGRSVIRAGVSLPMVLIYAFTPKDGAAATALSVVALVLAGFGLRGMIQMRTWGVLALGTAGAILVTLAGGDALAHHADSALGAGLGGGLLLAAAAPFARPMLRSLRV